MNADVTERMSAGEQAMADAKRMPAGIFDQIEEGGRGPATSRGVHPGAFIQHVAPDQVGAFTDREGRLSARGRAADQGGGAGARLWRRAPGRPDLRGRGNRRAQAGRGPGRRGAGLVEAARAWPRDGEIPRLLDLTPALTSAMDLPVRHAAARATSSWPTWSPIGWARASCSAARASAPSPRRSCGCSTATKVSAGRWRPKKHRRRAEGLRPAGRRGEARPGPVRRDP